MRRWIITTLQQMFYGHKMKVDETDEREDKKRINIFSKKI